MKEQTGVETSLIEDDMKQYLQQVINEVRRNNRMNFSLDIVKFLHNIILLLCIIT
jgi:hypothetical protein